MGQGVSLREKMTLFWHNHFVVEFGDINNAQYEYVRLLRQYALGNIRQLAKDLAITPAMLRYLNENASTATAPNENYGRELLELFTVGKGPLIGPGNPVIILTTPRPMCRRQQKSCRLPVAR